MCVARQGYAHQGYAHQGYAHQGYARQGYARQGYARQGYARQLTKKKYFFFRRFTQKRLRVLALVLKTYFITNFIWL